MIKLSSSNVKKNRFYLKISKKFFKNDKKKISKILNEILNQNSEIIKSLDHDYKNSFKKKQLSIIKKKFFNLRIIGMDDSNSGAQAIYDF